MSLMTGSCCCPSQLGRCCILDTTAPNVDCQDLCVDNKTVAQCTALGGVWELGACADVNPNACVGVCCATNAAGYFVACQEGVTQCECYSDNLAVGVTTTWHSGPNLTCADIACPCRCQEPCPCYQYIVFATLETITNHTCFSPCTTQYIIHESEPDGVAVPVTPNGLDTECVGNAALIAYYLSYVPTLGFSYTYFCQDGTTISQTRVRSYSASLGAVVCSTSICNAPQVNIGNYEYTFTCTENGPSSAPCLCQYSPNINVSTPVMVTREYCQTCSLENCVHEFDDCENCA